MAYLFEGNNVGFHVVGNIMPLTYVNFLTLFQVNVIYII
jgi:hypothetical protein